MPRQKEHKTHCVRGHPFDDENTYVNAKGYKTCRTCRRELARSPRSKLLPGERRAYRRSGTPEYAAHQTQRRISNRARRYGMTPDALLALVSQQGGACAICGDTFDGDYQVDHDHRCCPEASSCGECVRGLLCKMCNLGIAYLRDSPEIANNAAVYLA